MQRAVLLGFLAAAAIWPLAGGGAFGADDGSSNAATPQVQPRAQDYRLMPNDVVQINVFQEDDLTTSARIAKDGSINFPMIGTALIGGQTVNEADRTLEERLREYLVKPQVTISVTTYSKRRITILGQVNRPGTFDLPDDAATVNLLEAIGMAGGYTRIANPSRITLKRVSHGEETIMMLDAKKMVKDPASKRVEVLPGDTIVVGESLL